jgi:hypothetical protein
MSEDFLSRWSRLKRSGGEPAPAEAKPPGASPAVASPGAAAAPPAPTPPPPLPPIESLEPGADISQFMRADVGEGLKRQALRKLLQDPRFNVMDGLDVYIDDYSQPDPLPEGWLEKMNQTARLGDYHEPPPEEAEAQQPAEDAQHPEAAAEPQESTPVPEGEPLPVIDTSNAGASVSKGEQSPPPS